MTCYRHHTRTRTPTLLGYRIRLSWADIMPISAVLADIYQSAIKRYYGRRY